MVKAFKIIFVTKNYTRNITFNGLLFNYILVAYFFSRNL